MEKTVTVTLAGEEFVVKQFNIGQHELFGAALEALPSRKIPGEVLRIALPDATPPKTVAEVNEMQAGLYDISAAVEAILGLAGYNMTKVADAATA